MTITFAPEMDGDYPRECDNCGAVAPLGWFSWGPPYNVQHDTPERPLCRYCASATSIEETQTRNMARMFNEFEEWIRETVKGVSRG